MIGDSKQEQKVEKESVGIQSGRDTNYDKRVTNYNVGCTFTEVENICNLIFRDNFPKLLEEAQQIAQKEVNAFIKILGEHLESNVELIIIEKFREPDVQAMINDAVQACARKGPAASPKILSALISERVSKQANEYKDIVISEAVQVVPRLTHEQIALLTFIHFTVHFRIPNLRNMADLEELGKQALQFSVPGFNLSESQKQHIHYTGAASLNSVTFFDETGDAACSGDPYRIANNAYRSDLMLPENVGFIDAVNQQAPSYARLLSQYNSEGLSRVQLTSVGHAIAIANISNYINLIDYAIWLK